MQPGYYPQAIAPGHAAGAYCYPAAGVHLPAPPYMPSGHHYAAQQQQPLVFHPTQQYSHPSTLHAPTVGEGGRQRPRRIGRSLSSNSIRSGNAEDGGLGPRRRSQRRVTWSLTTEALVESQHRPRGGITAGIIDAFMAQPGSPHHPPQEQHLQHQQEQEEKNDEDAFEVGVAMISPTSVLRNPQNNSPENDETSGAGSTATARARSAEYSHRVPYSPTHQRTSQQQQLSSSVSNTNAGPVLSRDGQVARIAPRAQAQLYQPTYQQEKPHGQGLNENRVVYHTRRDVDTLQKAQPLQAVEERQPEGRAHSGERQRDKWRSSSSGSGGDNGRGREDKSTLAATVAKRGAGTYAKLSEMLMPSSHRAGSPETGTRGRYDESDAVHSETGSQTLNASASSRRSSFTGPPSSVASHGSFADASMTGSSHYSVPPPTAGQTSERSMSREQLWRHQEQRVVTQEPAHQQRLEYPLAGGEMRRIQAQRTKEDQQPREQKHRQRQLSTSRELSERSRAPEVKDSSTMAPPQSATLPDGVVTTNSVPRTRSPSPLPSPITLEAISSTSDSRQGRQPPQPPHQSSSQQEQQLYGRSVDSEIWLASELWPHDELPPLGAAQLSGSNGVALTADVDSYSFLDLLDAADRTSSKVTVEGVTSARPSSRPSTTPGPSNSLRAVPSSSAVVRTPSSHGFDEVWAETIRTLGMPDMLTERASPTTTLTAAATAAATARSSSIKPASKAAVTVTEPVENATLPASPVWPHPNTRPQSRPCSRPRSRGQLRGERSATPVLYSFEDLHINFSVRDSSGGWSTGTGDEMESVVPGYNRAAAAADAALVEHALSAKRDTVAAPASAPVSPSPRRTSEVATSAASAAKGDGNRPASQRGVSSRGLRRPAAPSLPNEQNAVPSEELTVTAKAAAVHAPHPPAPPSAATTTTPFHKRTVSRENRSTIALTVQPPSAPSMQAACDPHTQRDTTPQGGALPSESGAGSEKDSTRRIGDTSDNDETHLRGASRLRSLADRIRGSFSSLRSAKGPDASTRTLGQPKPEAAASRKTLAEILSQKASGRF